MSLCHSSNFMMNISCYKLRTKVNFNQPMNSCTHFHKSLHRCTKKKKQFSGSSKSLEKKNNTLEGIVLKNQMKNTRNMLLGKIT